MSALVALLTDYGLEDTYVAQLKSVILQMSAGVAFLDLTHSVPPQQVRSGAYLLATAVPYLPEGTFVVAVVDPGVGTARRAVAVQAQRHTYLAPDNGLLALALREDPPLNAVVLDNPRYHLPRVSATFHGRDIFAPACAHLINGVPIERLGSPISPSELMGLPDFEAEWDGSAFRCVPLHIDHFGNVILNLTESQARQRLGERIGSLEVVLEGNRVVPFGRTFGDVGWGEPVAYWGSSGHLEVAINGGSAREVLGLQEASRIWVRPI
ncbi:MAG: SAM-dependent chlorinase/fluorinase [Fimbriimonadales bacterium]